MKFAGKFWLILLVITSNLFALDRVPNQLIFKTSEPIIVAARSTGLADFDDFLQNKKKQTILICRDALSYDEYRKLMVALKISGVNRG